MAASDLLDQFRDRGMYDAIQRSVVKNTFEAESLEKLRGRVAKFKAVIQAHDAKVAAAQEALVERKLLAGLECMDESFAPPCSTEMTASGASEGNSHHHENKSTTVLAAARVINASARMGRPPLETVRCMLTEFRLFVFETGRHCLQEGTLDHIKQATVIKTFEELHPDSPPLLKSTITRDKWKNAVRANNIDMITMAWRLVAEVKRVKTVEEK
jgi:hypothetical protein